MRTSENVDELAKALATFQATVPPIVKSKTARAGSYSYTYADLGAILDVIRDVAQENGLSVAQDVTGDSHGVSVSTRVLHTSGQWMESGPLFLPAEGTAQAFGSAITYARRYALCAALGIVADDDDDGKASEPARGASRPSAAAAGSETSGSSGGSEEPGASTSGSGEGQGQGADSDGEGRQAPALPLASTCDHDWTEKLPNGSRTRPGWVVCSKCGNGERAKEAVK